MTAPKNPKPLGFPVSISADEVFDNLRRSQEDGAAREAKRARTSRPSTAGLRPVEVTPFGTQATAPDKPLTKAERFKASYLVGDTTPSSVDLTTQDIPGPMLLEVTEIECYDHNPRLFLNEKRDDIRHSIASTGFRDALVVTRRRPGDKFMLAAGSNTTLLILQDLFRQTRDEKYRWVNCMVQPFENDARILAQHLGENLNRGDMRFWEIAKGMTDLLRMIAEERARSEPSAKVLGLREQAEELTRRGLRADKTSVARWLFAIERLAALGPATVALTGAAAEAIQPRLNALRALSSKFKTEEATFWTTIVSPVLKSFGREFDADSVLSGFGASDLCDRIEASLAAQIDESVGTVRQMLSTLKLAPDLTLAELRQPSPNMLFASKGPSSRSGVPDTFCDDSESIDAEANSAARQAALPLSPGAVRIDGMAPSGHTAPFASAPPLPVPAPAGTPAVIQQSSLLTSPDLAEGPRPAEPGTDSDPLQTLYAAVTALLETAGLADTLRWRDDMPLGFFVELPDRALHARRKVALGSPEFHQRSVKTVVWWSLALMTGQFREGCVPFMDQASAFFRHFSSDPDTSALSDTDIEQSPPELDEILMAHVTPGQMRAAMQQMRVVEEQVSRVFERLPERWRRMLQVHGTAI